MEIKEFEIARSFSKTVQVAQYEPENYFCSAKAVITGEPTLAQQANISATLEQFCREEVMKSMRKSEKKNPQVCESCGGTGNEMNPLVRGLHKNCQTIEHFKTRNN